MAGDSFQIGKNRNRRRRDVTSFLSFGIGFGIGFGYLVNRAIFA
jgi:hypothetical protein